MEITDSDIEITCGTKPTGVNYTDPGNDPNFVFVNDPNFEAITLFDPEGNVIYVNSWLECAHYLKGGWRSNQLLSSMSEQYLSISLFFIAVVSTGIIIFLKKKQNEIN